VIDPNKPRNGEVTPAAKAAFGIQGAPEDPAKATYHPPMPLQELIPLENAKPPGGDDMCPPVQDPCVPCGQRHCHVTPNDPSCQVPVKGPVGKRLPFDEPVAPVSATTQPVAAK
jgi:hypothetical protein